MQGASQFLEVAGLMGTAAAISPDSLWDWHAALFPFYSYQLLADYPSSAIAALSANILYTLGIGQHRSVIILGTLMIFDSWGLLCQCLIREFTQNNYHSGLA